MKARIIQIGNSKGIRIPCLVLEQCGLRNEVELEAHLGELIIRSANGFRHGWAKSFEKMAQYGDDKFLDKVGTTAEWSRKEWKW